MNPDAEVTFLQRATEQNFTITPADADARALDRMREVREDDSLRLKIRIEELSA
jgi:hypothetical protein